MKHTLLSAFIGAFALVASNSAVQSKQKIVFAIEAKPGTLQQATAEEFTRRVNQRLACKAVVTLFDSARLGTEKELMQKLKLGTAHIALPSSIMSSIADEFSMLDMPFLVEDRDHLARIEKQIFWPDIAPAVEEKGYKVLAMWENGFHHITNNKRPINTPADLDGIRLRTANVRWRTKMFEQWGAQLKTITYSDVVGALQASRIDGQENDYASILSAGLPGVQKYISVTGHVYSLTYLTMSKVFFDQVDPEINQVLENTAHEMAIWARQQGTMSDKDLKNKLIEAGMELNIADRKAFTKASGAVYDAYAAEFPKGGELVRKALALRD